MLAKKEVNKTYVGSVSLVLVIMAVLSIIVLADPPSTPLTLVGTVTYVNSSLVISQNITINSSLTNKTSILDSNGTYMVEFNISEYNTADVGFAIVNFSDAYYGGFYGYTTVLMNGNTTEVNVTVSDNVGPSIGALSAQISAYGNNVTLNWSAPDYNDTVGYLLYRNGTLVVNITNVSVRTHNDTNLTNGVSYGYAVVAYDN